MNKYLKINLWFCYFSICKNKIRSWWSSQIQYILFLIFSNISILLGHLITFHNFFPKMFLHPLAYYPIFFSTSPIGNTPGGGDVWLSVYGFHTPHFNMSISYYILGCFGRATFIFSFEFYFNKFNSCNLFPHGLSWDSHENHVVYISWQR